MAPPTDEQLMARFQRGLADEAMDELVSRHLGPSLGVARQILSDPAAAEDAVQEALLRVVRSQASYVPGRPFATWFYTILRNVCRDALRGRARRARLVEQAAEALAQRPPSRGPDRPSPADMLARLPEPLRAALELRVVEDMPFRDVAAALGITEEAAKKRAQRGLRRLREWTRPGDLGRADDGGQIDVPDGQGGAYTVRKKPPAGEMP